MASNKTLVYVGPADKLDLRALFGADEKYVMYPEGSYLAGVDGAESGRETEFTEAEMEELTTNPALNGHRFTVLTAEQTKERASARKAREERAARLAKAAAELNKADGDSRQEPMLLNGVPVTMMGAAITEPNGEYTALTKEAMQAHQTTPVDPPVPQNTAVNTGRKAAATAGE